MIRGLENKLKEYFSLIAYDLNLLHPTKKFNERPYFV